MQILKDNKDKLVALSEILIEREVLDFEEVDAIMKTGKLPPERETGTPATEPAPEAKIVAPPPEGETGAS